MLILHSPIPHTIADPELHDSHCIGTKSKPNVNCYQTIRPNQSKGKTTNVHATAVVPDMVGDSTLTIIPDYLNIEVCETLAKEIEESDKLRQYARRNGVRDEPRLHVLTHHDASSSDMTVPGVGYGYKDIQMKAIPMDAFPILTKVAADLANHLGVRHWALGADVVAYTDGADGMGFHADNSQGETTVSCGYWIYTTDSSNQTHR